LLGLLGSEIHTEYRVSVWQSGCWLSPVPTQTEHRYWISFQSVGPILLWIGPSLGTA
jgi:hypothetical protein